MNMMPNNTQFDALKAKQNAAWSSGDYARIGITLQVTGEQLAESMDLRAGSKVLDVAAGNGNATLAFARRWCDVTSTDYVETLLTDGKARAAAEKLTVNMQLADAEALPFADESFDATVSTFGVMFTPNQERAAGELVRVTKRGGRIGLANWTPDSFIGALFKTLSRHVQPPKGLSPPSNWGSREWIDGQFESQASAIRFQSRTFNFRYMTPMHFVDVFRHFYGPVHKAFISLDENAQRELEADMLALIDHFNVAEDGSMKVPARYAEILIERK